MTALVTLWAGGFLALLDDGTRVISTRGMYRAIGAANAASSAVDKTPRFLRSKSLSPFVPAGFSLSTRMPLRYHLPGNNAMAPSRARARAEHATAAAYALNHKRRRVETSQRLGERVWTRLARSLRSRALGPGQELLRDQ